MEKSASKFALRFLPSMADVIVIGTLYVLFAKTNNCMLLSDGDTGWHIRTGEWILNHGQVPHVDIFSFTRPGQPWFAWEWLSDVVMASLFRAGGLQLVVFASAVLIALVFVLLFRITARRSTPLIALPITLVAIAASSVHFLARPHLFTLLFTVSACWILERAVEGRTRLLWALPPLTVLWTNLHGGFVVIYLLIGAYAAGEILRGLLAPDDEARSGVMTNLRRYGLVGMACVAASFVNPYGWQLHQHLVEFLTRSFETEHIAEFLPLSFQHPAARFLELLLAGGIGAAYWNLSRRRYGPAVAIAIWAHAALVIGRNIPLYALVACPFIAEAAHQTLFGLANISVAGWLRRGVAGFAESERNVAEIESVGRVHLVSIFGLAIVALLLYSPQPPKAFRAEYDPSKFPQAAVSAVEFGPEARVFTDDQWGDYLIWRLYPRTKVFIDGRSDFYGPSFGDKFIDVVNGKFDWEQTIRKYGVNSMLLHADSSLAATLKETTRWRVVYDDGVAVAFRLLEPPPSAGNRVLLTTSEEIGRDPRITKTDNRDRQITNQSEQPTI